MATSRCLCGYRKDVPGHAAVQRRNQCLLLGPALGGPWTPSWGMAYTVYSTTYFCCNWGLLIVGLHWWSEGAVFLIPSDCLLLGCWVTPLVNGSLTSIRSLSSPIHPVSSCKLGASWGLFPGERFRRSIMLLKMPRPFPHPTCSNTVFCFLFQ